MLNRKKKEN